MSALRIVCGTCVVALMSVAHADQGALSVEAGVHLSAARLVQPNAPPDVTDAPRAYSIAPGATLSIGWALTHALSVQALGVYDHESTVRFEGASLDANGSRFRGVLTQQRTRYGGGVGSRYAFGLRMRPTVGAGLLVTQEQLRSTAFFVAAPDGTPYRLPVSLADVADLSVSVRLEAGLQFQVSDRVAVLCLPALELPLDRGGEYRLTVPLSLAVHFYP